MKVSTSTVVMFTLNIVWCIFCTYPSGHVCVHIFLSPAFGFNIDKSQSQNEEGDGGKGIHFYVGQNWYKKTRIKLIYITIEL